MLHLITILPAIATAAGLNEFPIVWHFILVWGFLFVPIVFYICFFFFFGHSFNAFEPSFVTSSAA